MAVPTHTLRRTPRTTGGEGTQLTRRCTLELTDFPVHLPVSNRGGQASAFYDRPNDRCSSTGPEFVDSNVGFDLAHTEWAQRRLGGCLHLEAAAHEVDRLDDRVHLARAIRASAKLGLTVN
jgi:hypothetical protein